MNKNKQGRDAIGGVTRPDIRRLARRAGAKDLSGLLFEETRGGCVWAVSVTLCSVGVAGKTATWELLAARDCYVGVGVGRITALWIVAAITAKNASADGGTGARRRTLARARWCQQ